MMQGRDQSTLLSRSVKTLPTKEFPRRLEGVLWRAADEAVHTVCASLMCDELQR